MVCRAPVTYPAVSGRGALPAWFRAVIRLREVSELSLPGFGQLSGCDVSRDCLFEDPDRYPVATSAGIAFAGQ